MRLPVTEIRYPVHFDGVGVWVEVAMSDLQSLGATHLITPMSRRDGERAYLSNDDWDFYVTCCERVRQSIPDPRRFVHKDHPTGAIDRLPLYQPD